ncbi:HEPN domain-containing protein [Candidatus Rhodobacter oscarellae]|uniref:HEPN domain-containing protein n=1 Tax=Candidatus Rhodobacter oscarellae TaxID=1675527 RepID=UPI00128F7F16|nr:HEPN domain-containing protein [Candidatus Rhodobacter lobularis]
MADLTAISELVSVVETSANSARSRVASVNSSTLLLAARFEEFIREQGRQYAREMVQLQTDPSTLPRKLSATAWKRTLEELARAKIDTGGTAVSLETVSRDARSRIDAVCRFLEGDLTQEIYGPLVHNESNMRPAQLNAIFAICDLKDVCRKASDKQPLLAFFGDDDSGRVHGMLLTRLNDFMEKRNDIAHSLNPGNSASATSLFEDIAFFESFGLSIAETLPMHLPQAA